MTRALASDGGMEKLAADFIPGAFDVICSRGKAAYQHQGNRSFRATLEHHLPSYANARSKMEKTEIVTLIYHGIQEATPDGGFIRKNEQGEWCRVPSHVAREKVGQGFRDLLHTEYRSSTKAKIKRRRDRLYPPSKPLEEDEGKEQCAAGAGESDAKASPLGGAKISKSFSYDSEPLPLNQGQDEMSFLSQCSLPFDTAQKPGNEVTLEQPDKQGVPVPESPSHDGPFAGSSQISPKPSSPSEMSSCPAISPPQGRAFRPISQAENHTLPAGRRPPPYPYYQQYAPYYHRGDYQSYYSMRVTWGDQNFRPAPKDDHERRQGPYHPSSWY